MYDIEKQLHNIFSYDSIKRIFNSLDEGIIIVDNNFKILFYNKILGKFEGIDPDKVIGKNLFEVYPSLSPEESTICQVLKTGKPVLKRYQRYRSFLGNEIKAVNTTFPIIEKGNIIGAFEISRDITNIYHLAEKVVELRQIASGAKTLKDNNISLKYNFSSIIGENKKIKELIAFSKKVSKTSSSILIYGETGTGKELFAQSIHAESPRKDGPFIAQNCAALPESLLEALLFGTTKGSFTGAENKPGLFEQADGGTLLLDEINSMGLNLQSKLLRVLQEGVVRRIGAAYDIPVDVRIIATTNEKPEILLKTGRLRKDLFFRLSVIYIEIPPLRDRKEDIILLVNHFIEKYNKKFGKNIKGIDKKLMDLFLQYSWPGNIRELEHLIEGLMNCQDDGIITFDSLKYVSFNFLNEALMDNTISQKSFALKQLDDFERKLIIDTLRECQGNITRAAEKLGLKRQSLQYRIKKYGIQKETYEIFL
ncbi:sigma-54 interaction domain-containing protein [Thermovenabulum sp.]|uniref:sigma-54 interaction domain-containing protein n=1 Tax=Thermovenabulum sp. TaxID=3100335 RepID=UPI003C7E0870